MADLVYDLTKSEQIEIAERVRESTEAWEALEQWARSRLAGSRSITPEQIDQHFIERLEYLATLYINTLSESKREASLSDEEEPIYDEHEQGVPA